jgi:hypothetical protein
MKLTKWGESRIKHCVKYDLVGYARLITVQTNGFCLLLHCADKDDSEKWLEAMKGLEVALGDNNRPVVAFRSTGDTETERLNPKPGQYAGPLFRRLSEDLYESLVEGVRPKIIRELEKVDASTRENDLWEILAAIEDSERRKIIHDVFVQLRADKVSEAISTIRLFRGDIVTLDSLSPDQLPEIVDSEVIRRFDPRSGLYSEALTRFMKHAKYRDWMLFMHPDQERVVDEDFPGSAKLIGVSGSGKTCVIVRRAVRLATQYADDRILILTLNRALAHLIDELVTACAPEEERSRIDVKAFFVFCQEQMLKIHPRAKKLYTDVTWKNNEHVDEIWQEFYRCETNNFDARSFQAVHDSLLARGWDPERYLREETDWLRSALRPQRREQYLEIPRKGRKVQLTSAFKEQILEGVAGWEGKMKDVGVMDTLGLAQKLISHIGELEPLYRCVLVDELQDFGNIELEIVRAVVASGENDLFLAGDAAQAVTTKYQRLIDADIKVPQNAKRELTQNYRNSSDVLNAAYHVLKENIMEDLFSREDLDVLDPQASAFTGATPVLLEADSLELELRGAFHLARERVDGHADAKVCIAIAGYSFYEIEKFGEALDVPVLDGATSLDDGSVFLSDLPQTKGFEFDLVCILNCADGVLPDKTAPEEECFKELASLYVAMTRAKTELVLSWSGRPSRFLPPAKQHFLTSRWIEYVPNLFELEALDLPSRTAEYREGSHRILWRDMTGEQFLYTEYALGIPLELSTKIRSLVDGQGLKAAGANGRRLKWSRMGQAVDEFSNANSKTLWGPQQSAQFAKLIERLPASISKSQLTPGKSATAIPAVARRRPRQ